MAYTTVTDLSCDTVYSLGGKNKKGENDPTSIEGYYVGVRKVPSNEGGVSLIHVFQTAKGNQGIWGKADTNGKLADVKLGTMTKVTFDRIAKLNGGKKKYIYTVQHDRSNTIEVSGASADSDSSGSDDSTDYSDGTTYSSDQDEAVGRAIPAEEALQEELVAQAARQARVQGLLNKNKNKAS